MKIAVGSLGSHLDAWVGGRFGYCPQFVVVDSETMAFSVVPMPEAASEKEASLKAIQSVVRSGAEVLIVQQAKPTCRQVMSQLGVEVIDGVEGLTVRQAVERHKSGRLAEPDGRKGEAPKVAVAALEPDFNAPVGAGLHQVSCILIVDIGSGKWEAMRVEPEAPGKKISPDLVRALVSSGANTLVTSLISQACRDVLSSFAVEVIVARQGLRVSDVIEQYRRGELVASPAKGEM